MSRMILYSHGNTPGDEKTHYELVNLLGGELESIGYVPSTPESISFYESIKKHYIGLGFKKVKCFDIHNSFDNNGIIGVCVLFSHTFIPGDHNLFNLHE